MLKTGLLDLSRPERVVFHVERPSVRRANGQLARRIELSTVETC